MLLFLELSGKEHPCKATGFVLCSSNYVINTLNPFYHPGSSFHESRWPFALESGDKTKAEKAKELVHKVVAENCSRPNEK